MVNLGKMQILLFNLIFVGFTSRVSANDASTNAGSLTSRFRTEFFENQKDSGCKLLSKNPQLNVVGASESLQKIFSTFETAIEGEQPEILPAVFHPNTNIGVEVGHKILNALKAKFKKPWDVSNFKTYGLLSAASDKTPIACPDEQITFTPLYGYEVQIAMWLQLMGSDELSRILVMIVPKDNEWLVGGVHIQQWTFGGKDYLQWIAEANSTSDAVQKHIRFDVAQKLLFGGDFLEFDHKAVVLQERDAALTKEAWLAKARDLIKNEDVVYIGSILSQGGAGIIIRSRVPEAIATTEFTKRCRNIGKQLLAEHWLSDLSGGLDCQFILAQESPLERGILGAQMLSISELKK